mmetsp:Transcript_27107/g.40758  ORF Transcript_27107/g.40758 Transcript_27107/m.40758 type:complete len:566 (+) Transcript_27107:1210-2907(+)|eukprot:CAMPEP_0203683856 /NCGR_PEP_ID=MMETSP0090-20130426/47738_1 /ASSEMBLY_ACC=CAM_ASM_001088 /TAXON_ID=426623 /ORGANISM="Chaetoceros affinis, Strain CCMP159" /LENGTH=565 /DNA_ID=CAMNT_0050553013 /DNA_START=1171 /DNA_END=2871 /DNA_ORIENTATION=-
MVNQRLLTVDTAAANSRTRKNNTNTTTTASTDRYSIDASTPRTEASTPPSTTNAYAAVRGQSDIRSPGISKTPSIDPTSNSKTSASASAANNNNATNATINIANASQAGANANTPIPDFITQTDKFGNASTPRINPALQLQPQSQSQSQYTTPAKGQGQGPSGGVQGDVNIEPSDTDSTDPVKQEHEHDHDEDDDACDTLLESLRMMCCCLLPDSSASDAHAKHGHGHGHGAGAGAASASSGSSGAGGTPTRRLQITKLRYGGNNPHASNEIGSKNNSSSNSSNNSHSHSRYGYVNEQSNFIESNGEEIKLLPEIHHQDQGKKCLVLDLDETLVHSSFRAVAGADFVIPVQIEDVVHYVYVAKRPGVDEFLLEMSKHYEIILYTASLNKYADPLLDLLDKHNTIRTRLFRESCVYYEGNYVKDLSLLNRDLSRTIIVDNSPSSYIFHPENAIDCSSFIDDPADVELDQIANFLVGVKNVKDVRTVCHLWKDWPNVHTANIEWENETGHGNGHGANGSGSSSSSNSGSKNKANGYEQPLSAETRMIQDKQQKQIGRGRRRFRQQQQ